MPKTRNGIIVTGAKGFVGRELCRQIKARYPKADIWQIDLPEHDLRDPHTLEAIREYKPYVLFHLAAYHFIPWCIKHPRETLDLNAVVTHELLYAAQAEKVVLASSAAIYGLDNSVENAFDESDDYAPVDVYGVSKVWAEEALHSYAYDIGAGGVAARLFNVVGPEGEDSVPHLHPKIMAATGQEMPASAPGLTEHRDYVHVADAACSLIDLGERVQAAGWEAVNVSTGLSLSGYEMCDLYNVTPIDDPNLHRPSKGHLRGSNERLIQITGRGPKSPWERLLAT